MILEFYWIVFIVMFTILLFHQNESRQQQKFFFLVFTHSQVVTVLSFFSGYVLVTLR